MMAKSFNAFHSVNFPVLARNPGKTHNTIHSYIPMRERVRFFLDLSDSVCVLKMIPGMKEGMLGYLFDNYDCIIIESFGVGGIPDNMLDKFYEEMEKWQEMGKFIVIGVLRL